MTRPSLTSSLVLANLVLWGGGFLWLYLALSPPVPDVRTTDAGAPSTSVDLPQPPSVVGDALFSHALFSPHRGAITTVPKKKEAPTAAVSPPPRVLGTFSDGQETRYALLAPVGGRPPKVLHQGDSMDGWKVESIGVRDVLISRDGETHKLPLSPNGEAIGGS
ncbi:hypothetical protein G3580_18300 [Nitrogeniibacter mangrovi]|uniref:Type II secretion system protein GspC N-terminal domain-containing protein n=1 Tax=Nitrogeniibacter mangrovi TaxID=2016596 RepID=A0A6C1B981_9RHOO|nr:hypothetical protein [Nitrogeniibacter mangrovi]QID19395.1 hypothetical protein G3580_18300 [Nitrogeniibacter mangrovi]